MQINILIFSVSTTNHNYKAQLEATVGLQYNAQVTLHCSLIMFMLKLNTVGVTQSE